MHNIESILTGCIQDIRSGRVSMEECLGRYPELRHELEPLLKIALNIRQPRYFNLDGGNKQAVKARLLQQIGADRNLQPEASHESYGSKLSPRLAWARIAVVIMIAAVMIMVMAGGAAYASRDSLPGDLLYPVKTGIENIRLLLAGDDQESIALNLEFARTRLSELGRLAGGSSEKSALCVKGYKGNLEAALTHTRNTTEVSAQKNNLVYAIDSFQGLTALCDSIIDNNPASAEPAREATGLTILHRIEMVSMLAEHDLLQATDVNLNSMQERLQRALSLSNSRQYQSMQYALLEYQQFGQLGEKLQHMAMAGGAYNARIESMSLQAMAVCLDIIGQIRQQTPAEYRGNVEAAREQTQQYRAKLQQGQTGGSTEITTPPADDQGNSPGGIDHDQTAPQPGHDGTGTPGQQQNQPGNQNKDEKKNSDDATGNPVPDSHPSSTGNDSPGVDPGSSPHGNP